MGPAHRSGCRRAGARRKARLFMHRRPNPLEPLVAGDGSSIQPIEAGTEFAKEAEPLDRLAADVELMNRLMWAQYDGPEWRLFQRALAEYGVAVIFKWIRSGRIFAECARKGFGAVRARRHHDADDARGIAGETVARAFVFFRNRVLVDGIWDPSRGASIRTYFIGACILHFPNEYQRSLGSERVEQRRIRHLEDDVVLGELAIARFSWPDGHTRFVTEVREIEDPVTQEIALYKIEGYSEQEIADRIRLSRKAVETRIYRLRKANPWRR